MADEVTITFKASETFADRLAKEACDLDISKSAFLRACVMIASPILKDKPYLFSILERNGKQKQ